MEKPDLALTEFAKICNQASPLLSESELEP